MKTLKKLRFFFEIHQVLGKATYSVGTNFLTSKTLWGLQGIGTIQSKWVTSKNLYLERLQNIELKCHFLGGQGQFSDKKTMVLCHSRSSAFSPQSLYHP